VGPVTVKVIDNYNVYPLDSLLTNTDHLAEGFGLIQQDFDGMPGFILRGAKINGIVYGTVTAIEDPVPSQLPQVLRLDQNYPNPFNPTTTIRYALPKDAFVTLKIYNILGQEIVSLQEEMQNTGFHNVVWNGRNTNGQTIASGVYFYRLEARPADGAEPFTSFKKMLMLK